ncbi:hypothetical protein LTR62_006629 [Meristemomyces frigidus]|uniref:Uncharacterized protein n=1 Tax=Meristemomyces frigidus TaxID=1508187 RepID=A0AAN7TVJ6_9PEZI|nr:hypothetical protein LTR62_006629 [Meristemomyces frigidus]
MPSSSHRPSLSITLPPSFEFHYNDGQLPRTPECEERETPNYPPPPPKPQTFKVRRRRAAIPEEFQHNEHMSDTVIPTIEMSEVAGDMSSPVYQATPTMHGLLAPALPSFQRLVTPPKTPAPRMPQSFGSVMDTPANEWAMISDSRSMLKPAFERSGSVCSSFSDSSISSYGSSDFSAPNHGCASPESQATDPFLEDELPRDDKLILSPEMNSSPIAKRVKVHRNVKWTSAMDEHLWMTYMQYLSDPRVTPFKMLAGTPPPLGVCSRVASKARRTWSPRRRSTSVGLDTLIASDRMQREGSPDTIRPSSNVKQLSWPRSDGTTRKRLRHLCKRRPSMPAHYQRLLNTRSPSPFASSSSMAPACDPAPTTVFGSQDLKMSLVTATAPSMQPEGPLAQLTSDSLIAPPQQPTRRSERPADWFARIPRSHAHQKSLSLQSGLNLNTAFNPNTLESPFNDIGNRLHLLSSITAHTKSLGRTNFKTTPSLDSPVELSGAPTLPRTSLKRRFKSDEEKPKRGSLQDVFGPSSEDSGIVRNRGFSVGAVRATDNLAKLFTNPTPSIPTVSVIDEEMADSDLPSSCVEPGPPGSRSVPRRLAEAIPRLGSPFTEAHGRQFNTFPRSHFSSASNAQPFQQRLRELAAQGAANRSRQL